MTTDGNFNVKYVNNISIPQIIKGISTPLMGEAKLANNIGRVQFYYDSKNFYSIGEASNKLFIAPITEIINGNLIIAGQPGGENKMFASVYPTEINGYFYNFSVRNQAGTGQGGNIWRAPVTNPTAWYDTSVATPSNMTQPMIYNNGTTIYIIGGFVSGTVSTAINTTLVSGVTTNLATSANTLPAARVGGTIVQVGSTLYMYGGMNAASTIVDTVFSASTSDPTTWTNLGSLLPVPLVSSSSYNDGTYVWLFGGITTGSTEVNTIYRAAVATPTSFSSVGTIPAVQGNIGIFVYGTNMYLIGYQPSIGGGPKIYRAALSSLTSWTQLRSYDIALGTAVRSAHSAIVGNYVYLYGGINTGTTKITTIQSAPIATPLEWTTSSDVLPSGLASGQLIKTKNYLYLIGADGTTGNVYRAAITAPTTWSAYSASGPAYTYGKALISNGNVFYMGGETAVGTPVSTMMKAVINSSSTVSGDILGWAGQEAVYFPMALPIALSRFSLIVSGNFVYILGGYTTGPTVNYNIYRLNIDSISTSYLEWVNMGNLSQAVIDGMVVLINNMVYIVGGGSDAALTATDDYVTYASLSDLANGICSFSQENSAGVSLAEAATTVINNEVYFIGGRLAATTLKYIYKTIYKSSHTLISPIVPEATNSLPTVDLKTGAIGSYTSYQRTGLLPWLVSDL